MRRWKTEITEKMYKGWFEEVWENNSEYERFGFWEFKYSKSGIKVRKNKKGSLLSATFSFIFNCNACWS